VLRVHALHSLSRRELHNVRAIARDDPLEEREAELIRLEGGGVKREMTRWRRRTRRVHKEMKKERKEEGKRGEREDDVEDQEEKEEEGGGGTRSMTSFMWPKSFEFTICSTEGITCSNREQRLKSYREKPMRNQRERRREIGGTRRRGR